MKSEVGPSYEVEQMAPPSVIMELKPNETPSQDVLANHAVKSQDLTAAFDAWLPKVGQMVKGAVSEALGKTLPAGRMIAVKRGNLIKVTKEFNHAEN